MPKSTDVKVSAVGSIKVRQIKSAIRREKSQTATLISLGLNKLHRMRELPDTPVVRGMVNKVRHLLRIED